jgi:thiamine biosynthesis lipoprotein
MPQIEFRAMGCQMLAVLDAAEPPMARRQACLDEVPGWFEAWEQALSRFRANSELNYLNGCTGRWARVSPILWEVIQYALKAAQWSDGLVSPTLLNAMEAIGYDRSFEMIKAIDERSITSQPDGLWGAIKRRSATRSIQLPHNARLDLGGVAKGWAADRAARQLSAHGPALIDAGGDIALSGARADGSSWPIGVSDPLQPDRQLALLMITAGGVATSGCDYRRWQRDGRTVHHIIDPRTGLPAETDVLSATVIAPSAYRAEVAAKIVLISGSEAGLHWIESQPEFAALIVLDDGRVIFSSRLSLYLWS